MKKLMLLFICITAVGFSPQKPSAYEVGEQFVFRIHYQIINAGYATLNIKEATINNKTVYHVIGKGVTTGVSSLFFKVDDTYESYIDKVTGNPYQFVRKIYEGGYTKNQEGFFNPTENKILVKDYKRNTEKSFSVPKNTQDILSSFYYLRNYPNIEKMKPGEFVAIDMFFDDKTTKFRLKFIGREDIKTKFGVVSTMIFRPTVQTGRVFKEEESLTVWISDDENRIPLRIKASLLVGAIKADLDSYKGLKYPFKIKKNKRD
ncbi:DUF3108 domain-containing protein [Flavobacterium nackdongense]|uniref:DUF3108 domain-containing protein n=1 Tax=Flavobacterium nackdongense TaxID=2547394 RepID=A0A4P6Y957_9FLAO|nr:DUF3108 domain-containing protein [Flavobacterium nackdongense]QBN19446.1 DUF3108 domain-containing protein [Flavobacterium nackdongense]